MDEENSFFNCDFDSELFEEPLDKKASKQEKLDLLEFIGGFEKWNLLADDCKMYIVGLLDYWSRCNLSLCSKKDNQIVKETVLFITNGKLPKDDGIRMRPRNLAALCKSDFEQNNTEQAVVNVIVLRENFIEIQTTNNFKRSWKVTQKGDDCLVLSKSSLKSRFTFSNPHKISNSSAEEEFAKIVNKVMENHGTTVKKLAVLNKWYWVDHLNPDVPLNSFVLGHQFWWEFGRKLFPFEILQHPSIMTAYDLNVKLRLNITDEQFLSMKCPRMKFHTEMLSFEVLYEFIRRWVDDEIDYDFKKCYIRTGVNYRPHFEKLATDFGAVEYNYRSHRIPRYEEFFVHFDKYSTSQANFYQINRRNDPYNSISVLISFDLFLVLRTGFPSTRMGRPFMKLVFPEEDL
ncbi:unnamed protein product [Caenorhabditis brenneri]